MKEDSDGGSDWFEDLYVKESSTHLNTADDAVCSQVQREKIENQDAAEVQEKVLKLEPSDAWNSRIEPSLNASLVKEKPTDDDIDLAAGGDTERMEGESDRHVPSGMIKENKKVVPTELPNDGSPHNDETEMLKDAGNEANEMNVKMERRALPSWDVVRAFDTKKNEENKAVKTEIVTEHAREDCQRKSEEIRTSDENVIKDSELDASARDSDMNVDEEMLEHGRCGTYTCPREEGICKDVRESSPGPEAVQNNPASDGSRSDGRSNSDQRSLEEPTENEVGNTHIETKKEANNISTGK